MTTSTSENQTLLPSLSSNINAINYNHGLHPRSSRRIGEGEDQTAATADIFNFTFTDESTKNDFSNWRFGDDEASVFTGNNMTALGGGPGDMFQDTRPGDSAHTDREGLIMHGIAGEGHGSGKDIANGGDTGEQVLMLEPWEMEFGL